MSKRNSSKKSNNSNGRKSGLDFLPEMTLLDIPEMKQIGVKVFGFVGIIKTWKKKDFGILQRGKAVYIIVGISDERKSKNGKRYPKSWKTTRNQGKVLIGRTIHSMYS